MQIARYEYLRQLFSPPSLAAYVAWGAVWLSASAAIARDPALAWPVRTALLLFLLLFMAEHPISARLGKRGFVAVGILLALLALGVTAVTPHYPSPILLVLLAAMLATRLSPRELLLALVVINAGFAAIIIGLWPGQPIHLVISLLGYISFQAFAALVMRYAAQAQSMSEELRAVNADLLATRELLAGSARDAERLRLSRELHDVAGHKLTALKLNLAALARDPRFGGDERAPLCARLADELLADIRGMAERMRHDEGLDLGAALTALASPFPRPRAHIEIAPAARVASLAQAEAVLRTVQEGLTNAARHSQAQNLWVVLQREGERLQLDIRDDGREGGELRPGNGLTGMRERLEAAGGGLRAQRTETGGVHLQAWLPVAA